MSKVYAATSLIGGVAGSLDNINGSGLLDKDVAVVAVQDGNLMPYVLDEDSAETEASPYIISPDDNAGAKRWKLVGIQPAFSHVNVSLSVDQELTAGATEIIEFATENKDVLSEFNTTTYLFTATHTGYYLVNLSFWSEQVSYAALDYAQAFIYVDGVNNEALRVYAHATASIRLCPMISKVIYVTADQTIGGYALISHGSNVDISSGANNTFMTIDRIA